MKKTLLTLAIVAIASAAAFAQGKIQIQNNSQPVFFTSDTSMVLTADVSKAGGVLPYGDTSDPMPSGKLVLFGLYGGTDSTSLSLLTALNVNDGNEFDNGKVSPLAFNLPTGFPGGTAAFFQVRLWDAPYASYEAAVAGGTKDYLGLSTIFQVTPGSSVPTKIDSGAGTTWAAGNIIIGVVPEPSTFALAGLGAAALLIFRRRK